MKHSLLLFTVTLFGFAAQAETAKISVQFSVDSCIKYNAGPTVCQTDLLQKEDVDVELVPQDLKPYWLGKWTKKVERYGVVFQAEVVIRKNFYGNAPAEYFTSVSLMNSAQPDTGTYLILSQHPEKIPIMDLRPSRIEKTESDGVYYSMPRFLFGK